MRILAVAYFFPPVGGAGVQRNLRLVSGLSDLEHELIVVTGPARTTSLWAPHDAGLAAELSPRLTVRRVEADEPTVSPLRSRLERFVRLDSDWARWWRAGVRTLGLESAEGADLIWALMQPYASARPVAELSAAMRIPWVADLADPWALDEMLVYPSAVHRRLAEREMRRTLSTAAGIVMNTPEAARQLIESFPELGSKPVGVGPVGWDRRDFERPIATVRSETFRIVHAGYLHTDLGRNQRRLQRVRGALGGSRSSVDILTRSHVYLVRALDALVGERPDLRGRIELHLAGVQSDADRAVSSDTVDVRYRGYLEHPAAVELIRSADLLFLPMHELRDGGRATIVPGKTYEYLASGRPILAAVPNGDARDLLAEAGSASLCRPSDEQAMKEILERRVDAWLAGTPESPPRADVVGRYEYSRLSRDLAAFFGAVARGGQA